LPKQGHWTLPPTFQQQSYTETTMCPPPDLTHYPLKYPNFWYLPNQNMDSASCHKNKGSFFPSSLSLFLEVLARIYFSK
jgi:hypothetical protein